MSTKKKELVGIEPVDAAWVAVTTAFGSLGRICMALDADFRVLHCSERVEVLLGEGSFQDIIGATAESLLGAELFGEDGVLRRALQSGEKREGWRGSLRVASGTRPVSVTVAPLQHDAYGVCDRLARSLVVLRPAEEEGLGIDGPIGYGGLIARSPKMSRLVKLIENLEHSEATILLTGESGTGKEVVARAVHAHSSRRSGPFVAVNCGALPRELLESELFGHVRGAFTGAVRDRAGRCEVAAGGTLFLDEVGDVPLPLQVKLLRLLQERTYERVGESDSRRCDARIVAATNADLREAVADGRFREDLYYRLRVVPIELPPLRARPEDVELLAVHLLARVNARNGRALRLSTDAMRALLGYHWPGNVRELENALEYAVAVCRGQTIHPGDLPAELSVAPVPASGRSGSVSLRPPSPAGDSEIDRIRMALHRAHWRREEAARSLGMSRTTLWRKMREYGLSS